MSRIRVLLVDESVVRRDLLRSSLSEVADLELVGAAPTSETGLARARQARPDVVILSSSVGELAADELVEQLLEDLPDMGVILLAERSATSAMAGRIVRSLEAGAFDLVLRSDDSGQDAALGELLTRGLLPKVRAFSAARYSRVARKLSVGRAGALREGDPSAAARAVGLLHNPREHIEVVTLAISTGGPEALSRLIPALPSSFPIPVVVVIHMPAPFTRALAEALDRKAPLKVQEAQDNQPLERGVYLAPGGMHVLLDRGPTRALTSRLSDSAPENGCRPSADVLFRSAAAACPGGVLALIMTGMGTDGVAGLEALKRAGNGYVLAQDESSSVVWGMPGSAVRAGVTDEVLPLDDIAVRLRSMLRSG